MLPALFLFFNLGCSPEPPTLERVDPGLACTVGGEDQVVLQGEGLVAAVTGALADEAAVRLPEVRLELAMGLAGEEVEGRSVVVPEGAMTWLSTQALALHTPELSLSSGTWDVVLTDVYGQEVRLEQALSVAEPPRIRELVPPTACHQLDASPLELQGSDFLVVDDQWPTVTVGTAQATVVGGTGCAPLVGPVQGQVCTGLQIQVPASSLVPGWEQVVVSNPAPAGCATLEPASVQIVPPPVVHSIEPEQTCLVDAWLTLRGTGFEPDMSVTVGGAPAQEVVYVDGGTLEVLLDPEGPTGLQDLVLTSPNTCAHELEEAVDVRHPPLALFVDPPVVFSGISTVAVAHLADAVGQITDAWLQDAGGTRVDVAWSWDEASPSQVALPLPAGMTEGVYTVQVVQDQTCAATSAGQVRVVSELQVALGAVEPPFAWTFDRTAVSLYAADPPPEGQVGVEWVPGAWLLSPDGMATALRSLAWQDEHLVVAAVPAGLDPGAYDLLVVNPDGGLGLLDQALTVTWEAPPTVDTVSPASLPSSSDSTVLVQGRDFRGPALELSCQDTSGVITTAEVTVTDWSYATVQGLVPARIVNRGVCVLQVTNADGTWGRWPALSITNPAQNLFPWQAGPDLVVPRRAPGLATSRTSSVSRWVFALGGDDGSASGAYSSVEVAPIGVHGDLGSWSLLPRDLPEPRTLADAAVIGSFVYVVGGHDGVSAVDTAWRALVLDPAEAPVFEDLSMATGDGTGLGQGTWTWRVSALLPADDPSNPGGETLASDALALTLPAHDGLLWPTLSWSAVHGAEGYRVYRSPEADAGPGTEAWVADVTEPSFTDQGQEVDEAVLPLSEGALGEWIELPALTTPREAPCVATGPDPRTDPELVYLYAAGGFDQAGAALDSVEILDVVVIHADEHDATEWLPAQVSLSQARGRCGAFTVDQRWHSAVPEGESWIYFAGGLTDTTTTGRVEAGLVGEGGALGSWQSITSMAPARAGFGHASASNFLYAFGGQGNVPDAGGVSAELEPDELPDVGNWNSLGTSMAEERLLPGSAQESAIILVVGGQTSTEAATATTDYTNF